MLILELAEVLKLFVASLVKGRPASRGLPVLVFICPYVSLRYYIRSVQPTSLGHQIFRSCPNLKD
jgi:hypothetical protein